jgi:hypothetical protein
MKSLATIYAMYFNKKHHRVGPLFESQYKSVHIDKDEYIKQVSRYIHLNPIGFRSWDHSSYNDYLYEPRDWVSTEFLLGMFRTKKHYIAFVDDYKEKDSESEELSQIFGEI